MKLKIKMPLITVLVLTLLVSGSTPAFAAPTDVLPGKDAGDSAVKSPSPRQPTIAATNISTERSPDMAEISNYIKNTKMAKKADENEDDLPAGWAVHNPADTETMARVTWAKDDPRPGFYSIRLEWLSGGKYIAVQPELVKPLIGERPMILKAYPRTDAEGKAQFIVQCLDAAGKVIQEDKSTVIRTDRPVGNERDYTTLTIDFVTHPDTRNLRVYCANVGKGSVWFHYVTLAPDREKLQKMARFPFTVSCEPAEGNRFWNDGRAVLHSFRDSPSSISFAFWGDKSRVDNPRLVIEVPEGLAIPEAFNMDARPPVLHAKAEPTTEKISRDKAAYVRYIFPGPAALQGMQPTPYLDACLTMCFIPERYEEGKEYEIYYHAENGGDISPEKQATLRVLPPMPKTPNPKRFNGFLWDLEDINFYDMTLVEKVVRKYEEAHLAGRRRLSSGRDEINRVDQFLKGRGWLLFMVTGDYHFRLSEIKARDGEGKVYNDHRMGYCPTYVVTNKEFFETVVVPSTAQEIRNNKVEDGEAVYLDMEPGGVPRVVCFCERCRTHFAEKFNIPPGKVQTRRDILMNYPKEWGKYWTWLCDEIIRLHSEAVKRANPTLKNFMYSYALPFDNAEATENQLSNTPLDTRLNQKHLDLLGLSFYHTTGKHALDMIDINCKVLEKPVHMMPAMFGAGPFISAWGNIAEDSILSPSAMRMQILAAAASGAAGVQPYQGKLMDGMYFLKIDQAMSEIALLEDFYMDGKRRDADVSCEGLTDAALAGKRPILQRGWDNAVGMRAHKLGEKLLVTLFNFDGEKDVLLKLRIAGLDPGKWTAQNAINERDKSPLGGGQALTSAELAAGAPCLIPANDVLFVLIQKR